MAAHHLFTTAFAETWAIAPRAELPFPLVMDVLSVPLARHTEAQLTEWLDAYARRGPPWQEVVDVERDGQRVAVVLERFLGITVADLTRNLSDERWLLPPSTWLRLALDVLDFSERTPDVLLREPPCPTGLGWSIEGRLVAAPVVLNAPLATSADVIDHTVLAAPEHVLEQPLTERTLVFMAASLVSWLLTGQHPLEAEVAGHVGGLLRGERPMTGAWKLGSSPQLVAVLERAMAQDPNERFATVSALRAAIRSAVDAPVASRVETFSVLSAATHRFVDRLIEHLWSKDDCLPRRWDGVWPDGVHPLEGLSVLEDRLLEHRVDRRTFARRADVGPSLRPWRTPPERAEDAAAFRALDRGRWWSNEAIRRLPWRER